MKLRAIERKDDLAVKTVIQTSLKGFELDIPGTAYFDSHLGALTDYYATVPAAEYWVIENEVGEIVACGGYGPYSGDATICELQKLYVAEIAQGQGLSKLLMEKILLTAKRDYNEIYLETTSKLVSATFLYQKYGFQLLSQPLPGSEHGAMDLWYLRDL